MVNISKYQFKTMLRYGRKKGDELWFYLNSSRNGGLYIADSYCITTTNPLLLDYATTFSPVSVTAKTGYTTYTISPSLTCVEDHNRRNVTVNFSNVPKCISTGSWDGANPYLNITRTFDRVVAPTSYGTSWLNWLTTFGPTSRPYFSGYAYTNTPIFPNDHNWRKPFTKTQDNNVF